MVEDEIYKETQLLESVADATRTYVKDLLRPHVAALMPPDGFMPQAMSTSYVGREVMSRIRERFPEFEYRRAAANPMNPINQADGFEKEMLRWFDGNRDHDQWQGMITKTGQAYYARMRAIYAESECLQCHGVPADAPADMKNIYGHRRGIRLPGRGRGGGRYDLHPGGIQFRQDQGSGLAHLSGGYRLPVFPLGAFLPAVQPDRRVGTEGPAVHLSQYSRSDEQ
jgi:hypothetical protein